MKKNFDFNAEKKFSIVAKICVCIPTPISNFGLHKMRKFDDIDSKTGVVSDAAFKQQLLAVTAKKDFTNKLGQSNQNKLRQINFKPALRASSLLALAQCSFFFCAAD